MQTQSHPWKPSWFLNLVRMERLQYIAENLKDWNVPNLNLAALPALEESPDQ